MIHVYGPVSSVMLEMGHINALFARTVNPGIFIVAGSGITPSYMIPYRCRNIMLIVWNMRIDVPAALIEKGGRLTVIMISVFEGHTPTDTGMAPLI